MQRKTTEDFIGTCQACFGEFKVNETSQLVVLHGYKRPGHGSVEGQCQGTDNAPFEYETALTVHIITRHRESAEEATAYLADLKADKITKLFRMERQYDDKHHYTGDALVEYTPQSRNWNTILRSAISDTESRIFHHTRYADFLQSKVDAWQRGEIVGIDVPATGRVREYRKAFDPAEEKAMQERAAEKAARDAKPGKLKISFFQPKLARPGTYEEVGETAWRQWIEDSHEQEEKFLADIKKWVKANITGKSIVRSAYGSDLPRGSVKGDPYDFTVVTVNLPWEYRDQIETLFPGARQHEDAPKKHSYTAPGLPGTK